MNQTEFFLFFVTLQASVESDSDSSDCSDAEIQDPILNTPPKSVTELLRNSLSQHNMTSYESMAAQLATIASLNGFPSMYPGSERIQNYLATFCNP